MGFGWLELIEEPKPFNAEYGSGEVERDNGAVADPFCRDIWIRH